MQDLKMQIIDDWLEDRLLQMSGELEDYVRTTDTGALRRLTARLEEEAVFEGYDLSALRDACHGDVLGFLARHALAHMAVLVTPAVRNGWAEGSATPAF
jgi:hypothetical protein